MGNVVVLTAAAGVPDAAVAACIGRFSGAGAPVRLGPNAVEFSVPARTPAAPLDGIDVNIVPAANRRKRLFLADMDSTIISVECIDELADFAGRKAEVAEVTNAAMRGEIDFTTALDQRVAAIAGLTRADIEACRRTRVTLNPGAATAVKTMRAHGAYTALVSGGFTVFSGPVAEAAGFHMHRANRLIFEGDQLTGKVARPICGSETKLEVLETLIAAHGLAADDVMAVGDGANDLPMIARAGLGVAYRAKPALRAVADAVLDYSDLSALLALQGLTAPTEEKAG